MRFERLTRGHVVAAVAALALLLVMAMDWYGSHAADLAHQVANGVLTTGAEAGETGRAVKQDADAVIARDEKNAWQENDTLDRILLALLLLSVFLPLYAAARRADGKRSEPPWTPSALAGIVAAAAALLVAYRIINQPGNDVNTTVKIGAPLGLLCLAAIGLGSAWAFQAEARWSEMRRTASSGSHAAPPDVADPAEPDDDVPPPRATDQPAS